MAVRRFVLILSLQLVLARSESNTSGSQYRRELLLVLTGHMVVTSDLFLVRVLILTKTVHNTDALHPPCSFPRTSYSIIISSPKRTLTFGMLCNLAAKRHGHPGIPNQISVCIILKSRT